MRPATSSARTQGTRARRPGQRGRVLLPPPPRHRDLRRLRPLDIGITGRDLLLDSGADAEEILPLGFARSTFRFAARPGTATASRTSPASVATSYEGMVAKHLADHGIDASVVHLDGAVETAIQLGVAEVIADVVETGTTLRNAGLEVFGDPILKSEAVLIRRRAAAERGSRAVPAPAPGRPGRPALRDDGLRHPRRAARGPSRSPPAWSRRPSRRCTTRAGSPSARWSRGPTPSGSWTTCTSSAPAGILTTDIHACRL